jgi:aspartate racemase
MSWASTSEYYRIINEYVNGKLGKLHSAEIVMLSLDFEKVEQLQHQGKWDEATELMIDAARKIEGCSADFILICTNTMHFMADNIQASIKIPLLHIVDATAEEIKSKSLSKVGLLGTRFTMEYDFYKKRLLEHGIDVIIPDGEDRETVHRIIYDELALRVIKETSRKECEKIISELVDNGAEGLSWLPKPVKIDATRETFSIAISLRQKIYIRLRDED